MAIIRICYFAVLCCIMPVTHCYSQVIYYPSNSSLLLKATAGDVATLLQKSIPGSSFKVQAYASMPAGGIVLQYDSTITDNQACKVIGNGIDRVQFTAAEDNGLVFGLYQYLHKMGFRFYQPGAIWELIPSASTCFKKIDEIYSSEFKYRSWFISGGHRIWQMDKSTTVNWEIYMGENGHNWALYQRRNGMTGANRFAGHRGDIINGNYLTAIQNNPCYVACYNGSRLATSASVPDVRNEAAVHLWGNTIEQKFTRYRNTILNNKHLYVNIYRNFNYANEYIGIEVPDGPRWGNSVDNGPGCNNTAYASAADQSIILANKTAQKIKSVYPAKKFQMYAYAGHANIPSAALAIDSSIDVQVVATAFQNETSTKALLNRWYGKHKNISEYHYLNIPQWTGEMPTVSLDDLKQTVQRLKEHRSQGITWEASPAKFASLPYLKAANDNLLYGVSLDSSLKEFCINMFGKAATPVYNLLQQWSINEAITMGYFFKDNKHKIPYYLQLLRKAVTEAGTTDSLVLKRLAELKAYVHYMILYYDLAYDPLSYEQKAGKAAGLCIYLAKINKLQVVNSYYLITSIATKFSAGSSFFASYNVMTGTAYLNGMLPLITDAEIESNFVQDLAGTASLVSAYKFDQPHQLVQEISNSNFTPAALIKVDLGYTNGADYSNKSGFTIYAKAKGSFRINYTSDFLMASKGYINFSLENVDKPLEVVKEYNLNTTAASGVLEFDLPEAGHYALFIVSKYKSVLTMEITTNGNVFYKSTAFTHRYAEKYNRDMSSFPGYFFVPAGLQKVFFSVNNSFIVSQGYLAAAEVNRQFAILDGDGEAVQARLANQSDSSLFYFEIPAGKSGKFWRISNMGQFFLCFANISNILWFGSTATCNAAGFTVAVVKQGDECITRLTALGSGAGQHWEVRDGVHLLTYSDVKEVMLPNFISPNAVVTLFGSGNCSTKKKLSETPGYLQLRATCASGAPLPAPAELLIAPVVYPNPSNGTFRVRINNAGLKAEKVVILDARGQNVSRFTNTNQFDLKHLPAGIYWYRLEVNNVFYNGKIVKN